ncbi:MAG: MGDG synthase family glycosyltransferase [Verrucomicrobiales bacterium]
MDKKRILILSAGFGDGHNAAAFGLQEAFTKGGHSATVVDVFDRAHPALNEFLRGVYRFGITYTPKIWEAVYHSSDAADFTRRRFDIFAPSARALKDTLEEFCPDAVVSTYPLYAHLIERLVGPRGNLPYPFVSVVTDAQSINSIWYSSPSDHYCVIDQTSAKVLGEAGIPPEQIEIFGFPISPAFDQAEAFFPDSPLRILFLPSTQKRDVSRTLRQLTENAQLPPRKITVALGRHYERLKRTVDVATRNCPPSVAIDVIGWTDRIPTLLQTHHCVIGKAGGAAVQEAMAAHCPLLINYVVPGQEEGNAKQAVDAGCARVIQDGDTPDTLLLELLDDDRSGLKAMRAAAKQAGNSAAALQIADFVVAKSNQQ